MVAFYFRPDHWKDEKKDDIHCAWVCYLARRRIEQQKGFVIVKEQDGRQWNSPRADVVKQGIDVQFAPVERYAHGLVCRDNYDESGVLTNVHEITTSLLEVGGFWKKRKGKKQIVRVCRLRTYLLTLSLL